MNYKTRAAGIVTKVCQMLDTTPSADTQNEVAALIEQALMDAALENSEECAKVAMVCCSADRDLAHKIAEEIRRKNVALIANLSSMR
jgi:aspartate-semialdehyde dehydrogenase